MTRARYDVVIVGGGITGAIMAKQLDAENRNVLLLESGEGSGAAEDGYRDYVDRYMNTLTRVPNAAYPDSPYARAPNLLDLQHTPYANHGYFVQEGPMPFSSSYNINLGGTTLHWLGIMIRMLPSDFAMQENFKVSKDWAISYDTLEPYYRQAEQDIGVAADVREQSFLGIKFANGYEFPMQPIPACYLDSLMADRIDGMSYSVGGRPVEVKVRRLPVARTSTPNDDYQPLTSRHTPYRGQRCEGNSSCIPICPVQAKFNALKFITRLSPRVEIQTQSVASKVLFDSTGNVSGIQVKHYDASGFVSEQTVVADKYVLAGNAIENAKLMLASDAPNSNGLLGANLMDQPYLLTWGLMPEGVRVGPFRGPLAISGIPGMRDGAFRATQAAYRIDIGNYGWNFPADSPYKNLKDMLQPAAGGEVPYGSKLRRKLYDDIQRQFYFGYQLEQLPEVTNRVKVRDKAGKMYLDKLNNPRPVLEYNVGDYTQQGMKEALRFTSAVNKIQPEISDETVYKASDPGYIHDINASFNGSGHNAGTHCMGHSTKDGVVDEFSRSFEHKNLYMVGCGTMVTIGTSNPTLTATALTYRAAEHLIASLRVGK